MRWKGRVDSQSLSLFLTCISQVTAVRTWRAAAVLHPTPKLQYRRVMSDYDVEAVDRLPFTTPEKSARYRTGDYRGAVVLNWYSSDPTLQATMAYYLTAEELA